MALRLAKEVPQGIVADYWKVTSITIHPDKGFADITLSLFISEMTKDADPIANMTKRVAFTDKQFLHNAYMELKKELELAEAEDA